MSVLSSFGAIWIILVVIIAILWILLPFAVFGIKDLARDMIAEQRRTNKMLELLANQIKDMNARIS